MLGEEPVHPVGKLTLHVAIARVLADRKAPMRTAEVRDAVNRRNLYQRKDGAPVPSTQVAARVSNCDRLFHGSGDGRIELKTAQQ